MDGFEVTVGVLRDAGGSGSSVAGEVAVLPLAQATGEIVEALPGGTAAAAALWVAADAYGAAERAAVTALAGEP